MNTRSALFLVALLLLSFSAAVADDERLRNAKVVVTEQTLAPGVGMSISAGHAGVVVYLDDGTVEATSAGHPQRRTVRKGEAAFVAANSAALRNAGKVPLRLVQVGFLGSGSAETWGSSGLAPNYALLFENRYGRAYDIRIKAGESEQLHTHHDRVVICLSGARLRHEMPDGRTEDSTLKTGEIAWRRGGTHVGHNLGDTNLWVIAVEPK